MKDRIKSLKRIETSKLSAHPKNHRQHPDKQKRALSGLLDEIGWTTGLIVRPHQGGYQILDGHLRSTMSDKVPCIVVDLNDDEADLLLASHDAVTGMAVVDQSKLDDLLSHLSAKSPDVQEMLAELASKTKLALEDGREFDESCADDVKTITCPHCGEEFPL